MSERGEMGEDEPVVLENEFARVLVLVDRQGNSPRLRIEVPETGDVGYLDALSLERLAGLSQDELAGLFAVGQYRSMRAAGKERGDG
ncbi:MAG TPA: hypothetical protein VFN50_00485 [Acidimicrobiales bacterium]|nr:hypothetical protein [Acidimicrobiales bacterium]